MATALRLGLLLEIVLFALAALAVGASLRQADRCRSGSLPALIVALVFCNYTFSMAFLDGLETALAVALVFATYAWYRHRRQVNGALPVGQALVVGGLCGLCVMARVDAALFAAALALTHALPPRGRADGGPRPVPGRLVESSALLAAAAVVSVAGWLGMARLFGSPFGTSGRPISFDEVRPMSTWIASLRVLSNQCLGVVHLPTRHDHLGTSNIAGLLLLLAVAGFLLAVPRLRARARAACVAWRQRWDLGELAPLWLFAALLVVAYTLVLRVPQLQSHYLVVPRILLLFVLASFGAAFLQTFARRRALLLGALAAWTLVSLLPHAREFSGAGGNVMLGPAEWIRQNGGPEARVGMFQSGTTGFLYPERVVNLDGNVECSAPAAVRAGALSGFLAARHVRYLVDRREYLAFAWRDSALARSAVRLATLDNELEVWRVDPEPGMGDRPHRASP